MGVTQLKSEIAQRELSDLGIEITPVVSPQSFESIITKRLRPAIMCILCCFGESYTLWRGWVAYPHECNRKHKWAFMCSKSK